MEGLLKQARESLEYYLNAKSIPIEERFSRDLLSGAQGIALITEMKAGILFGVSGGSGIILCRDKNGNWSAPCSVGTGGLSWGFSAGVSKVDHIIILPTVHHVRTFMANSSLQIRGNAEACVANLGRDANVGFGISEKAASPVISYSFSAKGFYAGINIEGAVITARHGCNAAFYNRSINIEDLTNGTVQVPHRNEDYEAIVRMLNENCQLPNSDYNAMNANNNTNFNNSNNNNANFNFNISNVPSAPVETQPIMTEKPPLIRQNEISPAGIVKYDAEVPPHLPKNNNFNDNIKYPNLDKMQPL